MANDIQVDIKINGLGQASIGVKQLTDALEGLKKPSKAVQDGFKSIENGLSNVVNNGFSKFKTIAIASIASVAAVFTGKEVIEAAIAQEDAINKMNFALSASGQFSKQTSKDLVEFANEMQRTTRFSDDQVASTISLFSAINRLDKEGLKKATVATADLAAVLGLDLESASSIVTKSIEGNSIGLSRYGIQVKKGATETEQLNNTLQALAKFQGSAANQINTFGGALAVAKNAVGDVAEEIGNLVIKNPLFVKAIQSVTGVFVDISTKLSENRSLIIKSFNEVVKGIGGVVSALSPVFDFLISSLSNVLGIVRLTIGGFAELFKLMGEFEIISEIFSRIAISILEIPKGILLLLQLFADLAAKSPMIEKAFSKAGLSLGDMSGSLQTAIDQIDQFEGTLANVNLPETFGKGLESADKLLGKAQEIAKNQKGLFLDAGKGIQEFATVSDAVAEKTFQNAGKLQVTTDTFFGSVSEIFTNFGSFLQKAKKNLAEVDEKTGLTKLRAEIEKIGPSLVGGIAKGRAGAVQMFSSIGSAVGNAIIPGLGTAVQPFIELFAQGPEAVKKTIKEFVTALPEIFGNIFIYGVPALIEGLIEALPAFVEKFTSLMVIQMSSPIFWTKVATSAASAFVKSIPSIVQGFIDGFKDGLKQILPGGGGGGFLSSIPVVGGIADAFGFAEGGKIVKGGIPGKDSVPIKAMQGELIVDRSLTAKMQDFFDRGASSSTNDNSVVVGLLNQILVAVQRPMNVSTSVNVNQKAFADIILNLNRVNARLA